MTRFSFFVRDHAINHSDYFGGLTGLRGFAALWVFLYHAWVYSEPRLMTLDAGTLTMDLTPLFSMGWAGVDFFFVLSSFLLSLPFAHWACGEREYPHPGRYIMRRIRRIYPAYWVQLLILLVIAFGTGFMVFPGTVGLVGHALMYFNLPPWWVSPINGVWWTLPTEFLFYLLLLPLSLLLKTRATRVLLTSLIGFAWWYRWWVFESFNEAGVGRMVVLMGNTLGMLDLFIIGSLTAYLYVAHRKRRSAAARPLVFLLLGLCGLLTVMYLIHWLYGFYWEGHPLLFFKNTFMGISIAAILLSILLGSRITGFLLGNRLMMHFGIISYSIYLWHFPVILALSKWSFFTRYEGYKLPLMLAFSIPLVWLLSFCSYRWVERPFLKRKR